MKPEDIPQEVWRCPTCGGSGEVLSNTLPPDDRYPGAFSSCLTCKGTGLKKSQAR